MSSSSSVTTNNKAIAASTCCKLLLAMSSGASGTARSDCGKRCICLQQQARGEPGINARFLGGLPQGLSFLTKDRAF